MSNVSSWLRPLLKQVDYNSRSGIDEVSNVVDIPNGVERLRTGILHQQKLLGELREERVGIDEASQAVQMELQAAYEKNEVRKRAVESTLYKMRSEWMNLCEPLGIEAQIKRPELPPMEAENEP